MRHDVIGAVHEKSSCEGADSNDRGEPSWIYTG